MVADGMPKLGAKGTQGVFSHIQELLKEVRDALTLDK